RGTRQRRRDRENPFFSQVGRSISLIPLGWGIPGTGRAEPMAESIVVVGHAAVTCLGRDIEATWDGLIARRSGIRRHELTAGGGGGLGPASRAASPAVRLPVRSIRLALAAARAAWADAGLDAADAGYDPHRVAVSVGSAFGGVDLYEAEQAKMVARKSHEAR